MKFLGLFLRIAAAVYFCHLASWYLDQKSGVCAALLVGTIVVLFHETFRILIITNVIVEGWIDQRWMAMTAQSLPGACLEFFWGGAAVLIARRRRFGNSILVTTALVLAATVIGYFAVRPGVAAAGNWIVQALQLTEPAERYHAPYNFYVYKFNYGTFIEPTIAMFLIAWLAWPGLQGSPTRRIAVLAAVVLMMRGRVIATFFYCYWIKLPLGTAMAAEGQFFVETLILGICTGAVWAALIERTTATD